MTSSRPETWVRVVVVVACVTGLCLAPLGNTRALAAASDTDVPTHSRAHTPTFVDLRLPATSARRLAMAAEGAAQEGDVEKPRDMHTSSTQPPPQAPPATSAAAAKPASAQPDDPYAFVKDWPFWVIVGGVIVASAAGYMIYANANQESPCSTRFTQGCFGDR